MSYSPPESSGPSISNFGYCPSCSNFADMTLLQCALFLHLLHQIPLSVMGFQGNNSTKLVRGLGASNHMTNNPTALCHVRPYTVNLPFRLPMALFAHNAIGDASSKFTDVFLAPQLSTNLISVGQLVYNNCAVNFSGNGCVVQD
ncbi:hypothetical protein AAG906_017236 [Vitis piasezkii]